MRSGVIAQKVGMTRVFTDAGNHVPVTVLRLANCQVLGHRTKDKNGYIALQLGFGDTRLLEIDPVVVGLPGLDQCLQRNCAAAPAVRHAQRRDRRENVGADLRRVPGNDRTPVVPNHERALRLKRGDQSDDITDEMQDRVGLDGLLTFNGNEMSAPDGIQHWKSSSGKYWDTGLYDVTTKQYKSFAELQQFGQDIYGTYGDPG